MVLLKNRPFRTFEFVGLDKTVREGRFCRFYMVVMKKKEVYNICVQFQMKYHFIILRYSLAIEQCRGGKNLWYVTIWLDEIITVTKNVQRIYEFCSATEAVHNAVKWPVVSHMISTTFWFWRIFFVNIFTCTQRQKI